MSIINQMLKDMEDRKSPKDHKKNTDSPVDGLKSPRSMMSDNTGNRARKIKIWVLIILLIILVVMLLRLSFIYYQKSQLPASQSLQPSQVSASVTQLQQKVSEKTTKPITLNVNKPTDAQATPPVSQQQSPNTQSSTTSASASSASASAPQPAQATNAAQTPAANASADQHNTNAVSVVPIPLTPEQQAEKKYDQALAELNDGSYPDAIQDLQSTLEVKPDYLPAEQALITLLIQQGQYNLANQYLNQALIQRPQNTRLLQLKARLQIVRGHLSNALATLQSYSPPLSDDPNYYALIAAIQQRLGNYSVADQLYRQIIAIEPGNAKWWLGLGIALENLHKNNEAIEAYQRAASLGTLDPNLQAYVIAKITKLGGTLPES